MDSMLSFLRSRDKPDETLRLLVMELDDGPDLDLMPSLQAELQSIAVPGKFVLVEENETWRKLNGKLRGDLEAGHMVDLKTLPRAAGGRIAFNAALLGGVEYEKGFLGATLKARGIRIVALESGETIWALGGDAKTTFKSGITNSELYIYGGALLLALLALSVVFSRIKAARAAAARRREREAHEARERDVGRQLRADRDFRNRMAEQLAAGRGSLDGALKALPPGEEAAIGVNGLLDSFAKLESALRNAADGIATRLAASLLPGETLADLSRLEAAIGAAVDKAVSAAEGIKGVAVSDNQDGIGAFLDDAGKSIKEAQNHLDERVRAISGMSM